MCGIAGIYYGNKLNLQRDGQARIVKAMTNRMVHRGPDADGVWVDDQGVCALGHRRLSIIDTSDAGKQPMRSNCGDWIISFNGEIYNFKELRIALEQEGVQFKGRTDTEVLLAVLATWGVDGISKLDGMFAFAAFHLPTATLILARDPFGEKPLYYMELEQGGVAFSSELQCLEEVPGFNDEVCPDALAELLMFQYIGAPRSIYKQIKKLQPGHFQVYRNGSAKQLTQYFSFQPGLNGFSSASREQLADELEDILTRSLARRMIADVPLGAFLSGGVDSSTVCALARRKLNVPLQTFSMGFEGAAESEHEIARLFAQHLGTEHSEQIIVPQVQDFIAHAGLYLDEPNADSSCLPTYLLSRFARQSVTVALSGDGGDELFGGYARYFETLQESNNLINQKLNPSWNPGASYYSGRILIFTPDQLAQLFGVLPAKSADHYKQLAEEINHAELPMLCRLRKTDVENYMPGAVLPKVDRMSMQHSLEVRTPFLSVELAKFAERVPVEYLLDRGKGKLLLRDIAYRYLPKQLIDLPKKGFGLPLADQWGRDSLIASLEDALDPHSRFGSWIGNHKAQAFLNKQRSNNGFSIYQVWTIVLLEQWLRSRPARLPELEQVKGYVHVSGVNPLPARKKGRYFSCQSPVSIFVGPVVEYCGQADNFYSVAGYCAKYLCELIDQKISGESQQKLVLDKPGFFEVSSDYSISPPDLSLIRGLEQAAIDLNNVTVVVLDLDEFVPTPFLVQSLRAKGARGLIAQNIHDAQSGFIYYRFRYFSLFRRVFNALYLKSRAVARWNIADVSVTKGTHRFDYVFSDHLLNHPSVLRYFLFESLQQFPPVFSPVSDIEAVGGGRYLVDQASVTLSTMLATGSIWNRLFPGFFLVGASKQIESFLPISTEPLVNAGYDSFYSALNRLVGNTNQATRSLASVSTVVLYTHSLSSGGAERQWCNLADGLNQIGLNVTLVVNTLKGGGAHYLPLANQSGIQVIELDKIQIGNMDVLDFISPELFALFDPLTSPVYRELVRLVVVLNEIKPDVVVSQLEPTNMVGVIASLVADIQKVCISFRNYNPSHFSYLNLAWFLPCYKAFINSNRLVLTGNSVAGNADYAAWIGVDPAHIHWLPNSVEPSDFKSPNRDEIVMLRNEFELDERAQVILGVFRLSEEKEPLAFIDVCKLTLEKVPDAIVLLLGEGVMEHAVKQRIEDYGLQHSVKLVGRRQNVAAFLALARLLLLTSRFEGTPNVAMEALIAGIPVVATNVGALPELVVDGEGGFIRDVGDVHALADCCVELLTDDSVERRIKSNLQKVQKFFSKQDMAKRLISFIVK